MRGFLSEPIFVFGSNRQGRHGKGAAKAAMKKGAIYGQAEGLQGRSYAIITKELRKDKSAVTIEEVRNGVMKFLLFAKNNQHLTFEVAPIGCGLAGFTPEQIAPMFKGHTQNVRLPKPFKDILAQEKTQSGNRKEKVCKETAQS